MNTETLNRLKIVLREKDAPFFTDEELEFYYSESGGNFNTTAYRCLIIKSQNTQIQVSGLTTADTSDYFKRLAAQYRPSHSGVLK